MFSGLLEAVQSHFPGTSVRLTPEQHKIMLDHVFSWLSSDAEHLVGAARAVFGDGVFENSKIGFEYAVTKPDQDGLLNPPIKLAEMYVRPEKDQHNVSLSISVARGHTTPQQIFQPAIYLELEIQTSEAKVIFETLYKDYRAQIARLLDQGQIKFFTFYCSDIVGKSKSNKIRAKLDEYFTDPQADNWFTLSLRCPPETPHADGIRGFLALSVLYVACRSGLAGKGNRAAFEKNLSRLI